MLFGVGIPTCREGLAYPSGFADVAGIAEIAREAEALGFASLWANDHLATQHVVMDSLPDPPNFYEPLVTYAYLAGQTSRMRFVVATVVAPLREPVLLAKQVATLDHISQGRLVLGLGIGAYREEYEAIANRPAKANRGRMMEEMVGALRSIFDHPRAQFEGQYFRFAEIEVYPKPVQFPFPIYVSGNSAHAIRRAGRIADGWIAAGMTPEQTGEGVKLMRDAALESRRDPARIEASLQVWVSIGSTFAAARDNLRSSQHFRRLQALQPGTHADDLIRAFSERNLLGTPADIAERIHAYQKVGVEHLGLIFLAPDRHAMLDGIRQFGEEVLPHFRLSSSPPR